MKTWERVAFREHCGSCGQILLRDQPVLAITIDNVRAKKFRCVMCAGPAPPDLPRLPELSTMTTPMQPFKRVGFETVRDWSKRIVGERE